MLEVGKLDGETFGHASEDGSVDVVGSVRSSQDEDTRIVSCRQTVPHTVVEEESVGLRREGERDEPHEFCLPVGGRRVSERLRGMSWDVHHACHFVVGSTPLAEQDVDLVDKDDCPFDQFPFSRNVRAAHWRAGASSRVRRELRRACWTLRTTCPSMSIPSC